MTRLLWCTLSLLTHTHSATLFSTNWATLQTPLPVYVGSRSTQTTHSKTRVSYTVLIKDCPQVPLHVSNALWSCLLCRQTLRGAPWAINTHWQNIRTNEYLGGIEELFMSACKKKKKPQCTYRVHYDRDSKQWRSNAIQTTATWYSPGLWRGPRCYLGLTVFVSPDFIEGDLHNPWYVYNAFIKMDINWHNLD